MGIYEFKAPCGCIGETCTISDPFSSIIKLKCPSHGGDVDRYAMAIAGRAAQNWTGPANPYADPDG